MTLTARCLIVSQQNAPLPCSFSLNVSHVESTVHLFLPTHAALTTAIDCLESHLAPWVKPAAQEPPGVPNDAKSTVETTAPAGQPMSATEFSAVSTQVAGGPGGGVG